MTKADKINYTFKRFCFNRKVGFDNSMSHGNKKSILWLLFIIFSVWFILSFVALISQVNGDELVTYDTEGTETSSLLWSTYYHIIDSGNQHMATTTGASIIAAILSLFGTVFLGGLLISLFTNIFDSRRERFTNGDIHYKNISNHYVMIGYNEMSANIIEQIFGQYRKEFGENAILPYILVMSSGKIGKIRNELLSHIDKKASQKIIFYSGDRGAQKDIDMLRLEHAKEIYLLGEIGKGEQPEPFHDTLNMKCATLIANRLNTCNNLTRKIQCHVLFEYQTTFSVFQFGNLNPDISRHLDFMPINYYESWAQKIFSQNKATLALHTCTGDNECIDYLPLDTPVGIDANSDKHVHLIIIGMSKMGMALAIEAAHICHFPNFIKNPDNRTRITFIDNNAKQEMDFFKGRYTDLFQIARWRYLKASDNTTKGYLTDELYCEDNPCWNDPLKDDSSKSPYKHLAQDGKSFLDIDWEFIDGGLENPAIQEYLRKATSNDKSIVTIALCLKHAHEAVAAGIYMPNEIYRSNNVQQILIYQRESSEIIRAINTPSSENGATFNSKYSKLRPFGMLSCGYDVAFDNDTINYAKRVNYVYSNIDDYKLENCEKISEDSDKPAIDKAWESLSVALKWSNIYNANSIGAKMRSYKLTKLSPEEQSKIIEENIDEMAIVEHNRWNIEKLLMGFRPLNEAENKLPYAEKRALRKTIKAHIDICSFEKLYQYDSNSISYDKTLCRALPFIINNKS